MKCHLKFNMCGLETSHVPNESVTDLSKRIDMTFTPSLNYPCRFWADHVNNASPEQQLVNLLRDFAYTKLLYWLEALSLLGAIDIAASALVKVAKRLKEV